jgi:hypothetical protein
MGWSWLAFYTIAGLIILSFIGLILFTYFLHRMTADKYSDGMGVPDKEYREYLKQSEPSIKGLEEIPPPPDGRRDEEIEGLLRAGDYTGAHVLLVERMEEARHAPVGSAARIARISHYMEQLERMKSG